MTEQAYRYPKDGWTVVQAKAHCSDHDGILFEPASEQAAPPLTIKTIVLPDVELVMLTSKRVHSIIDRCDQTISMLMELRIQCALMLEGRSDDKDNSEDLTDEDADSDVQDSGSDGKQTIPPCCQHGEHPNPDASRDDQQSAAVQQSPDPVEVLKSLEPTFRQAMRGVMEAAPQFQAMGKAVAEAKASAIAAQRRVHRKRFLQ